MEPSYAMTPEQTFAKRPRSPTGDLPLPASKVARTHAGHLQINYLSKQLNENLPLVGADDTLPNILRLLGEYDGVLHRHESVAGNLGACPLGPILLKRFERLFDGPPRILKSHGKEANITWLDVVDFAKNKPEQFNLEKMRNGVRVCQFYTKQSRVEISEEDYVLIASGMPQKLIPPQPIMEDEEKELGVIEILERNLGQVVQLADQVSARARQLNHKLKNRRSAILSRREAESDPSRMVGLSHSPQIPAEDINGVSNIPEASIEMSQSPPSGFMAVNMRQAAPLESETRATWSSIDSSTNTPHTLFPGTNTDNVTIINGKSVKGASPAIRAELMKQFFSGADREGQPMDAEEGRRASMSVHRPPSITVPSSKPKPRSGSIEHAGMNYVKNSPTVAIPSTPAALLPHVKPMTAERDDGGPFKAEMLNRIESIPRNERVIPPCDRCRRLHMDCLKNLTACIGCTKKHAKCSWKDVKAEELQGGPASPRHGSAENADTEMSTPDVSVAVPTIKDVTQSPHPLAATIEQAKPDEGMFVEVEAARVLSPLEKEKVETPTPRFDVRPPPIGQPFREPSNGRGQYSPFPYFSQIRDSVEKDDNDEGDRLQALAAQVYRSASQSVRPQEG